MLIINWFRKWRAINWFIHFFNDRLLIFGLGGRYQIFQVKRLMSKWSHESLAVKSKLSCKSFLTLSSLKQSNLQLESDLSSSHVTWVHTSTYLNAHIYSQTGSAYWWAWLCNKLLIHVKLVRAMKGQPWLTLDPPGAWEKPSYTETLRPTAICLTQTGI